MPVSSNEFFPQAQGPPIWVPDLEIHSIQGTVYSNKVSPGHIIGKRLWMQHAVDMSGTQRKDSFNPSHIGFWLLWQPGAQAAEEPERLPVNLT